MSLLSAAMSTISAFGSDSQARASERLKQARAGVTAADSNAGRASRYAEARAKEVELYPFLNDHRGMPDWSPAQDAGEVGVLTAKDVEAAAEVEFDGCEPRIEALRERVRQTSKQLANARNTPRIAAIDTHVEALRALGVDVGDPASAEAQREIGNELGRIADDLTALRADRRREGMPEAHLFSAARVENCRPLRNLGIYGSRTVLEGLRQAAYANLLTVEILDAACDLLGTRPVPQPWTSTSKGYEIQQRRTHWEETVRSKSRQLENRRLGLSY
jgi:hypothetical protein